MFTYSICSWSTMSYLPLLSPIFTFFSVTPIFITLINLPQASSSGSHLRYWFSFDILLQSVLTQILNVIFSPTLCPHVLSHFNHDRLLVTPWTVSLQAPLSMGSSRQEYWSGLPFSPPGDLPKDWICVSGLLHWQVGSLPPTPPGKIANVWCNHWLIFLFLLNYKSLCLFLLWISNM